MPSTRWAVQSDAAFPFPARPEPPDAVMQENMLALVKKFEMLAKGLRSGRGVFPERWEHR